VWQYVRGRRRAAVVAAVLAGLLGVWFATTDTMPDEFVPATPYLTTLLVLALFSQRLRPPRWIGRPYRKGEST
jgi:ABC-type uncharacterized transport system permease subunit